MSHHILNENLYSIWWIIFVTMLAPVFALLTRKYIPDAIWLLIFGVIIGPQVLKFSHMTEGVEILREIGMGFLFLLAGLEINTNDLKSKQGKNALITWLLGFSFAILLGLIITKGALDFSIVLGIATTSTALGTLLPILKDANMIDSNIGKSVLIHGAFGELLPIIAMSLLLSTLTPWLSTIILIIFVLLAFVIVITPVRFIRKMPLLGNAILSASHTTMQTTLRITVFILVSLMVLTAMLSLDIALGAFVAGIFINVILSTFSAEHKKEIEKKVEIVGFSFLIPVFFVTSGMNINLLQVISHWYLLIVIVLFIIVVRGGVVYIREKLFETDSQLSSNKEKIALGLYSASGLPVIVTVTEIAQSNNIIDETFASIMVTSGVITILIFPLIAKIINKKL
ncbi:cation:proton antiporter [Staphylococcus auricularis]|uniref:cation:proton antiporter n=1 Tax=Staphylococcus auricularis TaxID=29379 RepID=UPI003F7A38FE